MENRNLVNDYYSMTCSEIAEELGISVDQVKWALRSGLKKLRHYRCHMWDFRDLGHYEYRFNCKLQGRMPWKTTDLS